MAIGRLTPTAAPHPNNFDPYNPSSNLNATEYMFKHKRYILERERAYAMRGSRGSAQHVKFMDHIRRMNLQHLLYQEMTPNEFNSLSPTEFYALEKHLYKLKNNEDSLRCTKLDISAKAVTKTKPKLTWLEEMRAEINEWLPKVA